MNNASAKMEQLYIEMLMSLSPEDRLRMACRMYDTAKTLVIAGIRMQMPNANEAQIRAQFFLRMHGTDFTPEELAKIMRELPNMQFEG